MPRHWLSMGSTSVCQWVSGAAVLWVILTGAQSPWLCLMFWIIVLSRYLGPGRSIHVYRFGVGMVVVAPLVCWSYLACHVNSVCLPRAMYVM